jgi:hypothetical protein
MGNYKAGFLGGDKSDFGRFFNVFEMGAWRH